MKLNDCRVFLNETLAIDAFDDYCPNGLQVQGCDTISKIVTGVTASLALIEKAISAGAQAILVHHGIFWKKDPMPLIGFRYQRVKALISANVNLLAYHLPLDCHETYGNNVQLGQRLGLVNIKSYPVQGIPNLFWEGECQTPMSKEHFNQLLTEKLDRIPLHISAHQNPIKRIGWCTGAAQSLLSEAVGRHLDAFVTGEISESSVHIARETGVDFFGAGHHATERYGVMALGELLVKQFNVAHEFIDVANPV